MQTGPPDGSERELREQLRQAWREIAELQWQLQAEQRNNKRQERVITSGEDALADAREEHASAMADRDQDLADLEDAHTAEASIWENERKTNRAHAASAHSDEDDVNLARLQRGDLGLLREFLVTCGQAPGNADIRDEILGWAHRCSVVLAGRG